MSGPSVSVVIPVLNAGPGLSEVLEAVRTQAHPPDEILVVDSASSDGSVELARRVADRVIEIPRAEFRHGPTRNMAMRETRGDIVCFLTQDATPASPGWLQAILEGFALDPEVALVFGPHLPRAGAKTAIAREMRDHFRTWGDGERVELHRLERGPDSEGTSASRPMWELAFFSDVNGAVARWAWEQVPYRDVRYAEDQLLGREMIEHGWAKAFHPDAAVIHSHDYRADRFLRRYFDEFRGLHEVLGHTEPFGPRAVARHVTAFTARDATYLREQGMTGPALGRELARSATHHTARAVGAGLGGRADRMPPRLRRALSLEGRATFEPAPQVREEERIGQGDLVPGDPWRFIRAAYRQQPPALEPPVDGMSRSQSLTIAWIVPPWRLGSGGHTTTFRLVRMMEERGHHCAIWVFDPMGYENRSAHELGAEIRDHFVAIEGPVLHGLGGWIGADVAVATQWWTAFALRDLPGCREKVYLVQDYEPAFHEYSSEWLWADATYRMGLRTLAYTPWMAQLLERQYGVRAAWFECGTDLDTYPFGEPAGREPATVVAYARQETGRRAVEMALVSLAELKMRRPDVRVVLFGSHYELSVGFEAEVLGVVPPQELAELYRRATVGVCFSLTTHSLVAQEMMASGLPVVELAGENVASALGPPGEVVAQAAPDPVSIASEIERLVDDPGEASAMARRARSFVETRDWPRAGDQVEEAMRTFLAERESGEDEPVRTARAGPSVPAPWSRGFDG